MWDGAQRSLQLRECALRDLGEILVDDRPFCRDSYCKHANVQPKAVFSYTMTVMDKISGWEDEERWVGSKFAGVHVDLHQRVLTSGRKPTPEMEECLKQRLMSIMICTN